MDAKPKLYHLETSQSLRTLWLLKYLAVEHELEIVHRNETRDYPQLTSVHELGKSPVLVIDGKSYAESRLCMEEIVKRYGNGKLDKHGEEEFRDRYYAEFSTASLQLTVMLVFIFDLVGKKSPWLARPLMKVIAAGMIKIFSGDFDKPLAMMEKDLSVEQPFFGGKTIGLSDFIMSWPLDIAVQREYIELDKYPNIRKWYDTIHSMPSYKEALDQGGVYDLVNGF